MANISQIRLSGVTYTIVDSTAVHSLAEYSTTAQMNQAITAATDALAQTIAEQGYQTSADVQSAISGKADISDLQAFFGAVDYDSNTKRINFYNETTGGTVLAYIDASDFVRDGFLQSVTIENKTIEGQSVPCLVFVWNTDSGIQETDIPLSGIFDPSNYVDIATYNAFTAATNTALQSKQETLVSGTNIKTINGTSILGSGNIVIEQGTVDQTIISGSTNAVAGGAVYDGLAAKNQVIGLDGETLVVS